MGRRLPVLLTLVALLLGSVVAMSLKLFSDDEPVRPSSAVDGSTAGQRGINVATMLSQAVTIYDHPEVTGTGEPQSTYDMLASAGHRLIRLPIDWNYLQPNLDRGDESFHPAYWAAIRSEVTKIDRAGMKVVLDLHNGCEWLGPKRTGTGLLCGTALSQEKSTSVWRMLSEEFAHDPAVVAYDLFNEPTRFAAPGATAAAGQEPYSVYQQHVNAIVAALRARGDRKEIWVESLCCTMALDIYNTDPNGGWVVDPANRTVYSLHMYPAADSTRGETFDPAKLAPDYEVPEGRPWADLGYDRGFLRRLDAFGGWCERHELQCSIGEVGWYGNGQSEASAAQWNALGDRWYDIADDYGLAVTYYGASSAFTGGLWAYDAPGPDRWYPAPGMTRKQPQAAIIEKAQHLSKR